MQELETLTGKRFSYKICDDKEIIVYPNLQEKLAIVITPYVKNFVKERSNP